ncbi:hypothetical protein RDI58_024307 [Solanum bulbocastanum]|uniref:Uncharacterized protein n=1 Tax=Solanum bulbocastanum TaxID=147425 RepID=A0AAN8T0U3_SOLBU
MVYVFYFRSEHIEEIKKENPRLSRHNVDRIHNERFQLWFRYHVEKMHMAGEKISEDIQTLAIGPLTQAKRITVYICDGVRYLTESGDVKKKTQNSGIMLKAITQRYASTKDKNPILAELLRNFVEMVRKRQRNSSQGEILYDSSEQQKQQIKRMSMPQLPQNWPQNERDESHDTENLPNSKQQKQQIGSMSMPQPPQNWPQNERDESLNTKNLPDSNESEEQSKRTRGPTMTSSGWGKDGGNLHIELNEHGQDIGSEGTRLSSKHGVLAQNGILAPLNHKDLRLVPSIYKDRIWAHIKENTDATDDMLRILMMSFGSKWKESMHEAKTIGYDPYNTDIECLTHCPDRVEEDQWRSLVHYWSSKEAKNN